MGLLLLCNATKAAAYEFTYRGVRFCMTRTEVSKFVPLEPGTNRAAGRTSVSDNTVVFQFDDKGQFSIVEISYWIPDPKELIRAALKRAPQKKYAVSNTSSVPWDLGDALMSFEEYSISNVHYLQSRIRHKRLYNEYFDRAGAVCFSPGCSTDMRPVEELSIADLLTARGASPLAFSPFWSL
jgi:hypothetical protein